MHRLFPCLRPARRGVHAPDQRHRGDALRALLPVLLLLVAGRADAADLQSMTVRLAIDPATGAYSGVIKPTARLAEGETLTLVTRDGAGTTLRGGLHEALIEGTADSEGLRARDGFVFTGFATDQWLPLPKTDKGPDLIRDRFTWDLTLVLPPGLVAVASGAAHPVEVLEDGREAHRFVLDEPTPAYLLGFAAGPFSVRTEAHRRPDGTRVSLQYLLSTEASFPERFGSTGPALAWMEHWTGVRYPDATYTQVLVPGRAAQEKHGFALLGEATVALADEAPEEAWYVIHEIAHQWFGRTLGPADWSENWLNEGFAVLATQLFSGTRWGAERGAAELTRARTRYARVRSKDRDRPLRVPNWKTPGDSGGPIPYTKGLVVLDLLRRRVGADAFDASIQAIFRSSGPHERFSSEALVSALAMTAQVDLADVIGTWIDGVGDPAVLLDAPPPLESAP